MAQLILLALDLATLLIHLIKDGEEKKYKTYDFNSYLLALLVMQSLLYWGGWYDGFFK